MTPLAPLPEHQRLGFINHGDVLRCIKDAQGSFRSGVGYAFELADFDFTIETSRRGPDGQPRKCKLKGHDVAYVVKDDACRLRCYIDHHYFDKDASIVFRNGMRPRSKQALLDFMQHFEIPQVMDVAQAFKPIADWARKSCAAIEKIVGGEFKFRPFQVDDLARMACVDGVLYAGGCGVGKTPMGVAWLLLQVGIKESGSLCPSKPVLIVAPAGLFDQMRKDYINLFGSAAPPVIRLRNQQEYARILAVNGGHLPPAIYMSSFTELATNKYQTLPEVPSGDLPQGEAQAYMDYYSAPSLDECRRIYMESRVGIGETRNGITCVYIPTLGELVKDAFAAIVIDEATHVGSEDSQIGVGVRQLRAPYRLALSGTPARNRVQDLFFLLQWAGGDRWPYASCEDFKREFTVQSDERLPRGSKSRTQTPMLCNTQKLWRVLSSVLLRRTKESISDMEIVPKIYKTIYVPMSEGQASDCRKILASTRWDRRGVDSACAKVAALRMCLASHKGMTPKLYACLSLIREIVWRGEQFVVFSPFNAALDRISDCLSQANLQHDIIDGRRSQSARAESAAAFKAGLPTANHGLLAGIKACAEGYSWHLCNNVIIYAPEWSLDLMLQLVDRCHRINSRKPVNIYQLVVENSVEEYMYQMHDLKSEAADLAMDGEQQVMLENDISYESLLEKAMKAV